MKYSRKSIISDIYNLLIMLLCVDLGSYIVTSHGITYDTWMIIACMWYFCIKKEG